MLCEGTWSVSHDVGTSASAIASLAFTFNCDSDRSEVLSRESSYEAITLIERVLCTQCGGIEQLKCICFWSTMGPDTEI